MLFSKQSFKSKVNFHDVPEVNHSILLISTLKMQYFGGNKPEMEPVPVTGRQKSGPVPSL
jgi:hypothetical protein